MIQPTEAQVTEYVSYVCLVSHEARNVRLLVKHGYLEREPYSRLCDSLATNRYEAWSQLQPVRAEAAERDGRWRISSSGSTSMASYSGILKPYSPTHIGSTRQSVATDGATSRVP